MKLIIKTPVPQQVIPSVIAYRLDFTEADSIKVVPSRVRSYTIEAPGLQPVPGQPRIGVYSQYNPEAQRLEEFVRTRLNIPLTTDVFVRFP